MLAVVNADADNLIAADPARMVPGRPPGLVIVAGEVVQDLVGDGADLKAVQAGLDGPVLELAPALILIVSGGHIGVGGQLHQQAFGSAFGGQGIGSADDDQEIEFIHFLYLL